MKVAVSSVLRPNRSKLQQKRSSQLKKATIPKANYVFWEWSQLWIRREKQLPVPLLTVDRRESKCLWSQATIHLQQRPLREK
jgi:hypothetical protein